MGNTFKLGTAPQVTTNYIPKSNSNSFSNSLIFDNGTAIAIGNGLSSATPQLGLIEATDGSGTNIAGAELRLQGGQGTGTGAGGALTFYTSAAGSSGSSTNSALERMRITTAGLVGIGTTSPNTLLQVNTTSRTSGTNVDILTLSDTVTGVQTGGFGTRILATSNNGQAKSAIAFEADGGTNNDTAIAFYTQFSAASLDRRMTINRNGFVGIGTAGPAQILDVRKATANGDTQFNFVNSQNSSSGNLSVTSTIYLGFNDDSSGLANVNKIVSGKSGDYTTAPNANSFLAFHTTSANTTAEKLRITAGGFTKASNNATYISSTGTYHEFNSNINNNQIGTFTNYSSSPYGIEVNFGGADPNNATNWGFGYYASSPSFVWLYRIYSNGTVAGRSDARWKKNIETTRNGYLEDLCKLRVVKYNWYNHEEDAPKELGLIAQEVEEVFPNLITYDKVTTKKQVEQEDGTFIEQDVEDGETRSIKISVLPYMLLKALQEAMAKIEELEAKVSALENKS